MYITHICFYVNDFHLYVKYFILNGYLELYKTTLIKVLISNAPFT